MRDKINRMKIGSLHMQSPYIGIGLKITDVNLRSSKVMDAIMHHNYSY